MEIITINWYSKLKKFFDSSSPLFSSRLSLLFCVCLSITYISLGSTENSFAMLINGLIGMVDVLNSFLILIAANQSIRQPDIIFNFGYGKYENMAILISALLLSALGLYTLIEAFDKIGNVPELGNFSLLAIVSFATMILMRKMYMVQLKASIKYNLHIIRYDAEIWKYDSYFELGVLANLLTGAYLIYLGLPKYAMIIDSISAIILIFIALKAPLQHGKTAFNHLLDRTLSEQIQLDLIAVIAENFHNMCEYRALRTRQAGKDIFIEIDVVMPDDFTLVQSHHLEYLISEAIKSKYPTAKPRVYAIPCNRDCNIRFEDCPVKRLAKERINNSIQNQIEKTK